MKAHKALLANYRRCRDNPRLYRAFAHLYQNDSLYVWIKRIASHPGFVGLVFMACVGIGFVIPIMLSAASFVFVLFSASLYYSGRKDQQKIDDKLLYRLSEDDEFIDMLVYFRKIRQAKDEKRDRLRASRRREGSYHVRNREGSYTRTSAGSRFTGTYHRISRS